jgi:hypothetical protein
MSNLPAALKLLPIIVALGSTPAFATEYLFQVSCPGGTLFVRWKTGDIDPGREYLKFATGTHHWDCSVSDYDGALTSSDIVEVHEGSMAIVSGIPFIGHTFGSLLNDLW